MKNKEEKISNNFSDKISIFHDRAQELCREKDFLTNLSLNISWNKTDGLTTSTKLPDQKTIKSFALTIRPFIMIGEAVHVPTICNQICNPENRVKTELTYHAKAVQNSWNRYLQTKSTDVSPDGIGIEYNGENLKTQTILDTFFHGKYFHLDREKLEKIKAMTNFKATEEFLNMQFITILQELAIKIFYLDEKVIRKLTDAK